MALLLLQFPDDKIRHQLIQVQAGVAAVDAVVFVRIDAHLKLLIGLLKGGGHIEGVLEMHVVVARAVNKQVVALQTVCKIERRVVVVTVGVVLRTLQETLGVNVVIVAPRGDGCHGDGALEDIVALQDAERRQVAAKAPAKDTDAALINPRLAAKPFCSLYCIDALVVAQIPVGHLLPVSATSTSATTVKAHHHITLLRQHTEPVVVAPAVAIRNLLVTRTAIHIEEQRILLVLIKEFNCLL